MLDCRQNVLASINTMLRRIALFQGRPDDKDKHVSRFLGSLSTELELLRSDLVLVFNQNFYLRCKLDEREQQLQTAEKKLAETTSRMELALQMAKSRYEKQIHALKLSRFLNREPLEAHSHPPQSHSSAEKQQFIRPAQKSDQLGSHNATVKKHKEFVELRGSAGKEWREDAVVRESEFDLQVRGLLSEQPGLFSNNRLNQEMARSNEVEEQHSKKRRGRAGSCRKEEAAVGHRKKKSEELAELVALQFKVQPIKEKYFSTDLL